MVATRMVAARAAARLHAELHTLIAMRVRARELGRAERRELKPVATGGRRWRGLRWRRRRSRVEDDGGGGDHAGGDAAQHAQQQQLTRETGQLGSRATSTCATG